MYEVKYKRLFHLNSIPEMTHMINALFVDGNAELLAGMQRDFFSRRNRLNVLVATSVDEAMRITATQKVDVVITATMVHGSLGGSLLAHVRDSSSGTIRILVADRNDRDDELAAMPVAHRLLMKPYDVNTIADVIFMSCEWRDRAKDATVAAALTNMACLPTSSSVAAEFLALLDGEATAAGLAEIARQDPALTAKLLQMQATSFFGPGRDSTDLKMAISFLHFDVLRELVKTPGFLRTDDSLPAESAEAVQAVRVRCVEAASRAATRSAERGAQDLEVNEAWVAGLLTGVGALVTAEVSGASASSGLLHEYSAKSAYLAHLWGLPTVTREALEAFADKRPSSIALPYAS
jgi:HD-like signal output (HDOD) protein